MIKEYGKGLFPLNASFDIAHLMLFYILAIKSQLGVSFKPSVLSTPQTVRLPGAKMAPCNN
jgi:hypothetical protein